MYLGDHRQSLHDGQLCPPRTILSQFAGDISRVQQMWGQDSGLGRPFLTQTPIVAI